MSEYFRGLTSLGYNWLYILWIYLSVCYRFWKWRARLRLQQLHIVESTDMAKKQILLFVRHGQTTWNAEQKLPGQLPGISLTEKGREQAARLADALSALPISAIISSPLERARDTAEIIAQGRNLTIQFEPDLMDTEIGRWAGQNYQELSKTDEEWKAYVKDPTVAPEGIETFPQVQQRALAAIERWRVKEEHGTYLAFVTHADVVKLLIAHYTGLDAGRAGALFIDNASVSLVEIDKENVHPVQVVAVGWNPHPGWLKPDILESQKGKEDIPLNEHGEQKT